MRVVLGRGDDTEAVQPTAQRKVEVGLRGVDFCDGAVGEDEREGFDGVAGQTVLVCLPGVAAAEGETPDAWTNGAAADDVDAGGGQGRVDGGPGLWGCQYLWLGDSRGESNGPGPCRFRRSICRERASLAAFAERRSGRP